MDFTLKTFIAIGLTSVLADIQSRFFEIASIHSAWAALLGGLLLGFGLLALYRHRASLGGVGILGIYLQERFGIRAGLVQLAIDMCVLAAAFFVTTPPVVFYSVLGAVVLNLFVAINRDRLRACQRGFAHLVLPGSMIGGAFRPRVVFACPGQRL